MRQLKKKAERIFKSIYKVEKIYSLTKTIRRHEKGKRKHTHTHIHTNREKTRNASSSYPENSKLASPLKQESQPKWVRPPFKAFKMT